MEIYYNLIQANLSHFLLLYINVSAVGWLVTLFKKRMLILIRFNYLSIFKL